MVLSSMENTLNNNTKTFFLQVLKGVLIALSVSLIGILLFALILKFCNLNDSSIKVINQIIKIVSILLGVMFCLKKDKSKGLIKGAVLGAFYTLASYFLFSILVASFSFSASIIYDLIFSSIVGLICGVIFVNLKTKKY